MYRISNPAINVNMQPESAEDTSRLLLAEMAAVSEKELSSPSYIPKVGCYFYMRNMLGRLLGSSLRLPDYRYFWTTAMLADGVAEYCKTFKGQSSIAALTEYHSRSLRLPSFRRMAYLDEAMNANSLLGIYEITGGVWARAYIEKIKVFLMQSHVKSPTGTLPYRQYNSNMMLVDSIGMVCPFLFNYARVFKEDKTLCLAINQILEFIDRGVDPETGLPFHGYSHRTEIASRKVGWGRGVGWYLLGLSEALVCTPESHDAYSLIHESYKKVLSVIFDNQRKDGSFGEHVLDPTSNSDSSATAMLAYSCAKTIEKGLTSLNYLDGCRNAYSFIQKVSASGRVYSCSGEAKDFDKLSMDVGWYPWGQGAALALGSIMFRIDA